MKMAKKRFKESEIQKILDEYRDGMPIPEIIKIYGISQATFYNWKAKYGSFSSSDFFKLNKLKEDHDRLKRMFADLSLENLALKAQLKKRETY
jgi:putative transposase